MNYPDIPHTPPTPTKFRVLATTSYDLKWELHNLYIEGLFQELQSKGRKGHRRIYLKATYAWQVHYFNLNYMHIQNEFGQLSAFPMVIFLSIPSTLSDQIICNRQNVQLHITTVTMTVMNFGYLEFHCSILMPNTQYVERTRVLQS